MKKKTAAARQEKNLTTYTQKTCDKKKETHLAVAGPGPQAYPAEVVLALLARHVVAALEKVNKKSIINH